MNDRSKDVPVGVVSLRVDGVGVELAVSATTSLLRALRDAGHTATTGACEQGECGSCTVRINGSTECACLIPAAICGDADVMTVRGLVRPDLADALARHGAVQCGFCTPGFVVAAECVLAADEAPDEARVREALAGNLCRCTGYEAIVDAILDVDRSRRALA